MSSPGAIHIIGVAYQGESESSRRLVRLRVDSDASDLLEIAMRLPLHLAQAREWSGSWRHLFMTRNFWDSTLAPCDENGAWRLSDLMYAIKFHESEYAVVAERVAAIICVAEPSFAYPMPHTAPEEYYSDDDAPLVQVEVHEQPLCNPTIVVRPNFKSRYSTVFDDFAQRADTAIDEIRTHAGPSAQIALTNDAFSYRFNEVLLGWYAKKAGKSVL